MPAYVALLRAVNVGGTGKLPMSELKAMCVAEGFANVQTYIASGNVVFESKLAESKVKATLEKRLNGTSVFVRTAAEMAAILKANPFPKAAPNRTVVVFLDAAPAQLTATGQKDEEFRPGVREIYVHYPSGQGQSKLRLPAAAGGTGRNINTVGTLAEMAAKL